MTKVRVWVRCFHLPFILHLHFLLIIRRCFLRAIQQYSPGLLWSQCWYFILLCFYTGPNAGIEVLLSSSLWKPPGIHDSGKWWVQCCCCWFDAHFLPGWMRMTWSSLSLQCLLMENCYHRFLWRCYRGTSPLKCNSHQPNGNCFQELGK